MAEGGNPEAHDARPERRPGVPMEAEPRPDPDSAWSSPPRQPRSEEHLHRVGSGGLTPVYGTAQPPRGVSGALRRSAYRVPEHRARHWMLLLAADRLDVLEHRVPELLRGRGWIRLGRQMWANPLLLAAVAAGALYLARRSTRPTTG